VEIGEFVKARLDEDEAAAKAVAPLGHVYDMGGARLDEAFSHGRVRYASEDGRSWLEPDRSAGRHFARHDPARVLREVEAKRAILERHSPIKDLLPKTSWCVQCTDDRNGYLWPCADVRVLAAVYSDHPDYRAEWKP
jgi:hypothetical protein